MVKFAVEYIKDDYSEILGKFDTREEAVAAAKKAFSENLRRGGLYSVISADFESDAWKNNHSHRAYEAFW